jgi:hypothetical protein
MDGRTVVRTVGLIGGRCFASSSTIGDLANPNPMCNAANIAKHLANPVDGNGGVGTPTIDANTRCCEAVPPPSLLTALKPLKLGPLDVNGWYWGEHVEMTAPNTCVRTPLLLP